jgi:hypothetical protein
MKNCPEYKLFEKIDPRDFSNIRHNLNHFWERMLARIEADNFAEKAREKLWIN